MSAENETDRDRIDLYREVKKLGWRIDSIIDELDKFSSRIRSNTNRISRLKLAFSAPPPEEDEEDEEDEPQVDRQELLRRELSKIFGENIPPEALR